MGFVP